MIHSFIFKPGLWQGWGQITFSMAEDILEFSTTWTILPIEDKKIYLSQEVILHALPETMRNRFVIWDITETTFQIELENQIVQKVMGSGLITPRSIAWEFRRKDQEFEGYEIYELQEDGTYRMKGAFFASADMRTEVSARIIKN